jgi:hypothetical protein
MKLDMEAQLGFARLALEKEMTLEKLYQTLGMQKQKMISDRQATAVSENTKIAQVVASVKGNGAAVGA